MDYLYASAIALHALSAAIWVGGMVFAYMILRPATGQLEPPPVRLHLWQAVFKKFFLYVWHAVVLLPLTGYLLLFMVYGGFENAGGHIHIMHLTGWLMIAIFIALFFGPYNRFKAYLAAKDYEKASLALGKIRKIIATNTVLGVITVLVGAAGRFL